MKKVLKIGIFTESLKCREFRYDFYKWLKQKKNLEVYFLIKKPSLSTKVTFINRDPLINLTGLSPLQITSNLFYKAIFLLEKILIRKEIIFRKYFNKHDLLMVAENKTFLDLEASESTHTLSTEDTFKVKSLELDLIFNFSEKEITFNDRQVSKFGILSTRLYDEKSDFIGPPGFWEAYYKRDKIGYSLIQSYDKSERKNIISKGFFSTNEFYLSNKILLSIKSIALLKLFIDKILETGTLEILTSQESSNPIKYTYPNLIHILHYSIRLSKIILKRICNKFFFGQSGWSANLKWNVSFTSRNWSSLDFKSGKTLPVPKNHFIADPFLIKKNGKIYCFVEDFVYKKEKGHISVYEIQNNDIKYLGKCLEEPFHLSFPFLFYYKNELYMCPETSQKKQIRIYKCIDFPLKWELASICINNIPAADTLLFEHQSRWWMLTNIDSAEINDHKCELHIFSADSPLSSTWKPHKLNPIYIDPDVARNAGLILEQGRIIRAAQKQAYNFYGKSLSLFEITKLNEYEFCEKLILKIDPTFKEDIIGTHHISSIDESTVIDHVSIRTVF